MDSSLITYDNVMRIKKSKGYPIFDRSYDLNIVGIRANTPATNTFNDFLTVAYIDEKQQPRIFVAPGTTDPGYFWLEHPMNPLGAAIVKEGHYPDLWQIGMHKDYQALVQVGNITVYRDNNRDDTYDLDEKTLDTGVFGVDLHHSSYNGVSYQVDKWSAGCQVVANIVDFLALMNLVFRQRTYGRGTRYSYSLINEKDLIA